MKSAINYLEKRILKTEVQYSNICEDRDKFLKSPQCDSLIDYLQVRMEHDYDRAYFKGRLLALEEALDDLKQIEREEKC